MFCVCVCVCVFFLIVVFFFNSRLISHRVCLKWYNIIKGTHAWRVINFYDQGPFKEQMDTSYNEIKSFVSKNEDKHPIEFRTCDNKNHLCFPTNEDTVVKFLETFAGVGLQEVYLSLVSQKIMTTLRNRCPHLETLSFLKAKTTNSYISCKSQTVEDKLYIPPRLRRLEMFSPRWVLEQDSFAEYQAIRQSFGEKLFSLLSQCPNLRCISLRNLLISKADFQKFTENVSLKEIDLLHPRLEEIELRNRFYSSTKLDDMLTAAAAFMESLQRFRLDCYNRLKQHANVLEKFPGCVSHWANLKVLALRGVECSDESFDSMIPGLMNLNSLELEGPIVTSNVISMVGKSLKKITFLELGNGHYSDESLESLANHPSLERLWIYQEYSYQRDLPHTCSWLHAIYTVLVTLLKIKRVKMEGFRLIFLHTQESFPVIKSAEIEIINVTESVPVD